MSNTHLMRAINDVPFSQKVQDKDLLTYVSHLNSTLLAKKEEQRRFTRIFMTICFADFMFILWAMAYYYMGETLQLTSVSNIGITGIASSTGDTQNSQEDNTGHSQFPLYVTIVIGLLTCWILQFVVSGQFNERFFAPSVYIGRCNKVLRNYHIRYCDVQQRLLLIPCPFLPSPLVSSFSPSKASPSKSPSRPSNSPDSV